MQFWFQIMMMIANGSIKLSVVAFYRRVFCTLAKRGKLERITKFCAVVAFLWTVTFFFIDIFACGRHIFFSWGPLQEQLEHCPDGYTTEYSFAVSDFILDVNILALPLPAVRSASEALTILLTSSRFGAFRCRTLGSLPFPVSSF